MSVSHADAQSTACEFVRQNVTGASSLRIAVGPLFGPLSDYPSPTEKCGADARKLIGVGNEAFACTMRDPSGAVVEQVTGRVRQRAFILRWVVSANVAKSGQEVDETVQALAEAVAGSMF